MSSSPRLIVVSFEVRPPTAAARGVPRLFTHPAPPHATELPPARRPEAAEVLKINNPEGLPSPGDRFPSKTMIFRAVVRPRVSRPTSPRRHRHGLRRPRSAVGCPRLTPARSASDRKDLYGASADLQRPEHARAVLRDLRSHYAACDLGQTSPGVPEARAFPVPTSRRSPRN